MEKPFLLVIWVIRAKMGILMIGVMNTPPKHHHLLLSTFPCLYLALLTILQVLNTEIKLPLIKWWLFQVMQVRVTMWMPLSVG